MGFTNCYEDATRAEAYAQLEFANTCYLAYRDLPDIIREHVLVHTIWCFPSLPSTTSPSLRRRCACSMNSESC